MTALDMIADANPLQLMFLDHAREKYWTTMRDVMANAVALALGGGDAP